MAQALWWHGGTRLIVRIFVLAAVFSAALLLNLCLGAVSLAPAVALQTLLHPASAPAGIADVLWQIRLPRLLCACAVGASLSVSGYLLQSLSRNYLADPYLTGVSSGSAAAVALAIVLNAAFSWLPAAALAGGLLVSLVVAAMARTPAGLSITRLLLAGIAVSAVCSSLITLSLSQLAAAGRVQGLYYWLAGSINGRSWADLQISCVYMAVATVAAFTLSKPLRLLRLGPQQAASLGLNVAASQWSILLVAVVLCGAAVSLSGIVGFVGLVAPYLARRLYGSDERWHLLTAGCLGATLVLLSDLCARIVGAGLELPLGTLLSLVGAPFFLWLVLQHKDEVQV
jgi:iron complex transport system permease protein